MRTMREYREQTSNFGYYGPSEDWLIAYSTHRDADVLDRANWQSLLTLCARYPETDWTIEGFSHWAVGHGEWLLLRPNTELANEINDVLEDLKNYPVIDDEVLGELEEQDAVKNCEMAVQQWLWNKDYRLDYQGKEKDIAPYILHAAMDNGKDIYREYWPDDETIFLGMLRYRRALRRSAKE